MCTNDDYEIILFGLYFKARIYNRCLPNSFHFHFYLLKFLLWDFHYVICSHSQLYPIYFLLHIHLVSCHIYIYILRCISTSQISLDVCSFTGKWFTYQGLHFLRKLSFPLLAFKLTATVGTVWSIQLSRLEIGLNWTCTGLRTNKKLRIHPWSSIALSRRCSVVIYCIWLLGSFHPLFCSDLRGLQEVVWLRRCLPFGMNDLQFLILPTLANCRSLCWSPSSQMRTERWSGLCVW